jgi:tRNA1(Val) A37 N6-methylase TrmN6
VEIQAEMEELARQSAEINGLSGRVSFTCADLRSRDAFAAGAFDLVVSNPPYNPVAESRVPADGSVALSRHEIACTLDDVLTAAGRGLAARGSLLLVYPAPRLPVLLAALPRHGLAASTLRFVHPGPGRDATLCVVRSAPGRIRRVSVLAPYTLTGRPGESCEELKAFLAGGPPR